MDSVLDLVDLCAPCPLSAGNVLRLTYEQHYNVRLVCRIAWHRGRSCSSDSEETRAEEGRRCRQHNAVLLGLW